MIRDIDFFIPIYKLNKYRMRNLSIVVSYLQKYNIKPVIIEQLSNMPFGMKFDGVRHITLDMHNEKFNKPKIMNMACMMSNKKYLWINDCDVVLNYGDAILEMEDFDFDGYMPFKHVINMDEKQTVDLVSNNSVSTKDNDKIKTFSGGSFVIKREIMIDLRGFNEDFVERGFEDREFEYRYLTRYAFEKSDKIRAFHLFHDRDDGDREALKRNKKIFDSCVKSIDSDIDSYINSLNSRIPRKK